VIHVFRDETEYTSANMTMRQLAAATLVVFGIGHGVYKVVKNRNSPALYLDREHLLELVSTATQKQAAPS